MDKKKLGTIASIAGVAAVLWFGWGIFSWLLKFVLVFGAGAATGALVTRDFMKKRLADGSDNQKEGFDLEIDPMKEILDKLK